MAEELGFSSEHVQYALLLDSIQVDFGAHTAFLPLGTGSPPPQEVKQQVYEADHTSPPSVEVENVCSLELYFNTTHICMVCCLIMHRLFYLTLP
jgi:hypothetical protein